MDAYSKGLDGPEVAWAARKYRGHRVLPDSIMAKFDASQPQTTLATTISP